MAVGLIKKARALADKSDSTDDSEASAPEWLFPSPRGAGPINPASVNLALRRAQQPTAKQPIPSIKLDNVVPHDLRRTAASGMTALGISRLTVAKILNHTDGSVTGVYDRYSYDAEQRHALDAWAAHLDGILTGQPPAANVVPMSLAAGNEPA